MIKIRKGLDLPIAGDPTQKISEGPKVTQVALIGPDYNGMKPTMAVEVGATVKKGQQLFEDKKNPGVIYTSPAGGVVSAINRGEKRVLLSVVIDVAESEEEVSFASYDAKKIGSLTHTEVRDNLVASGLWTTIRTRPYSKSPQVDSTPEAIFVNAMDTNPLAADPGQVLINNQAEFTAGLDALKNLSKGKTYLCYGNGSYTPTKSLEGITPQKFSGAHPAGLTGTHIHFLRPASEKKVVWSVNYQDVVAMGHLFLTGKLNTDRVISIAGPQVTNPRLISTRVGANIDQLTAGELKEGENRIISGSVLWGHIATGAMSFLGRFSLQVSALKEGRHRDFMGWQMPGFTKYSTKGVYASTPYAPFLSFNFTTSTEGSKRAMVPTGMYEDVMPLDIEPVYLLRAIITEDTDQAQALGALELDEEDLALCTFVCTGKYNYGSILRNNLTIIEKEG
ncbi:MAG: Na(+)-translocating NADH-quinone reductase subunit A [SAR324 cluster bacterium]|nr:Na(+)-translocating NADH-quinone reductase subunit A [SAR324 cluster bacterium]